MSWLYRTAIRPSLFNHNAEEIHGFTLHALGWASRHEFVCDAMESFLFLASSRCAAVNEGALTSPLRDRGSAVMGQRYVGHP